MQKIIHRAVYMKRKWTCIFALSVTPTAVSKLLK